MTELRCQTDSQQVSEPEKNNHLLNAGIPLEKCLTQWYDPIAALQVKATKFKDFFFPVFYYFVELSICETVNWNYSNILLETWFWTFLPTIPFPIDFTI